MKVDILIVCLERVGVAAIQLETMFCETSDDFRSPFYQYISPLAWTIPFNLNAIHNFYLVVNVDIGNFGREDKDHRVGPVVASSG